MELPVSGTLRVRTPRKDGISDLLSTDIGWLVLPEAEYKPPGFHESLIGITVTLNVAYNFF